MSVAPQKEADKTDFFYRASHAYLLGATSLDMVTTWRGLSHSSMAYREDGSFLKRCCVETGWSGFVGNRNTAGVIALNVLENAGVDFVSRKLYRRGGHWRAAAIGLNILKGTGNLMAGINNIRYEAGLDAGIRKTTGYTGRIVWAH